MKLGTYFLLSASFQIQPARKHHRTASLALRYRFLYGRPRRNNTGKELDSETGLYYYGARYLDPRVSRWISGDPAMGEYIPSAPVSDEARKRNGNLPGMVSWNQVVNGGLIQAGGLVEMGIGAGIATATFGAGTVICVWGVKDLYDGLAKIGLALIDVEYNGAILTVAMEIYTVRENND